jgi:RimJ/RimL family protein N-acetyltransferase
MIDFGHGVKFYSPGYNDQGSMTFKWRNNYQIWKWCRQNDVLNIKNHVDWFEKITKDPTIKMYSIHSDTHYCVGMCGLTDIDRINQRAEFSLYIGPEFQGSGFGASALKTLLAHGFLNQNLNVIWGETFEGNPAYDMFLKLGMKHEGTRRQFYFKEGKHIDAHLVSMTRQEYMEASWKQAQL